LQGFSGSTAEVSVNRILIKCPATGKFIYTGFAMDPAIFEFSPVELNPVECPICKGTHRWTKKDAFFEGDYPEKGA
jgi:hypothetical protein